MLYFVVDECKLRGCHYWRMGNNCVKNEMHIPTSVKYLANIHDNKTCLVRKQIDEYRLKDMLEK